MQKKNYKGVRHSFNITDGKKAWVIYPVLPEETKNVDVA